MWFVFVIASIIYTVALWLISLAWLLTLLVPYLIVGGVVVYFVIRSSREQAKIEASLEHYAERHRELNRQEMAAWEAVVVDRQRDADRRTKAPQKFDKRR